ncbi:MAG TPA: helix-turn-helix domain-containing protein [Vicinamibacteria bacterium]|nr:helix-turn-helix domain-containing protein [Vicinamibacteria bacterium]
MAPATEAARPDDLYAVLGLQPRASAEQVERAYRFWVELYGEGTLGTYSLLEPEEAEAHRSRVREAYEVLGDAERRRAYDESRGYEPPEPLAEPGRAAPGRPGGPVAPVEVTGAALRRYREARGVSLGQIATVTKIGQRYLEYIEADRFDLLPAAVYLRGFLQQYALFLGLEPRAVAQDYMKRLPKA